MNRRRFLKYAGATAAVVGASALGRAGRKSLGMDEACKADGMKSTFWRQRTDPKEESPPKSSALQQDTVARTYGPENFLSRP